MDAVIASFAAALTPGLIWIGKTLLESGMGAALEPANSLLKAHLPKDYKAAANNKKLLLVIQEALENVEAPIKDEDALLAWFKQTGLARLLAKGNHALRRQIARGLVGFTDPNSPPPKDLMIALGWPRSRENELAQLLSSLRAGLAGHEDWKDLLAYADQAEALDLLRQMLHRLEKLDHLIVQMPDGKALRAVIVDQGLGLVEAEKIEERFRSELIRDLYWHNFQGIFQMKQDIRLPLEDIYLELGLLDIGTQEEQKRTQERLLALREVERVAEDERRLEQHVTDAFGRAQCLVILGEPGSGKTMSLRFIALMLAYGYGAPRLGLEEPYIPLLLRVADYARELQERPALSLDNYLFEYIQMAYASHPRLSQFLRLVFEQGACLVLLDGMDEVGGDPLQGKPLKTRVVQRIQQFADRWCSADRPNRLVATSRIEGYWDDPLRGFMHFQLSPLRPPDEVEEFLIKWYTAHEQAHEQSLPLKEAEMRARGKVDDLLPSVMEWPSVRRLATNPLLLTILALIHENVGRLPNRRIKLYEIAAQTLIESWRQAQTGLPDELLAEIGEESVIRIIAPLAYWLHEERPGGTASYEDWSAKLTDILKREGYEKEAQDLAGRFLNHARYQAGLLAERGLGQFGFFHLTFEEYLAARQIARQRTEERRAMLSRHWEDPRWQEVILLAAGQLGIAESRTDDASDFVVDLLKMESAEAESAGRQAVLAGRALVDMGVRSVTNAARRWVMQALDVSMKDLDPDQKEPNMPGQINIRTRAAAGDTLDELGWLPPDLHQFVYIPSEEFKLAGIRVSPTTLSPFYIARYPVTNAQYERFLQAQDFLDEELWRGFAKFNEKSEEMKGMDWEDEGWKWLQSNWDEDRRVLPRYWNDPRFGITRRGVPVVAITWYEANAYCCWLQRHWDELAEGSDNPGLHPGLVRLPTEVEWVLAAGGSEPEGRYPWDQAGQNTTEVARIIERANVDEAGIGKTTPMGMYPLGQSQPYGLWDMAGNVFEWQANFYEKDRERLALRGGAWDFGHGYARVAVRSGDPPDGYWNNDGFRVVAFPR